MVDTTFVDKQTVIESAWMQDVNNLVYRQAWTAYAPSVSAQSGAYAQASAVGYYCLLQTLVLFNFELTITNVGTGTFPIVGLPFVVDSPNTMYLTFSGRERTITGKTVLAQASGGNDFIELFFYDNSNPAASGAVIDVTGYFQKA